MERSQTELTAAIAARREASEKALLRQRLETEKAAAAKTYELETSQAALHAELLQSRVTAQSQAVSEEQAIIFKAATEQHDLDVSQAALHAKLLNARVTAQSQAIVEEQALAFQAAQAAWAADQQKVASALTTYRQRVALEDQLYAATHGRLEVLLYEHEAYYARLRALHADNARMMALVNRAEAADRARLLETGGMGGAGFGGRMTARMSARFLASQALGEFSPQAGYLASMAIMLGGMGAVIATGFAAAGMAIRRELQSVKDFNAALAESETHAQNLGEFLQKLRMPPVETTPRGREIEQRIEIEKNRVDEIKKKMAAEGITIGGVQTSAFGQTDFEEKMVLWRHELEATENILENLNRLKTHQDELFAHDTSMDMIRLVEQEFMKATDERFERIKKLQELEQKDRDSVYAVEEARINAAEEGFQRELDLLDLEHDKRVDAARMTGEDMLAIEEEFAYKRQALANQEIKRQTEQANREAERTAHLEDRILEGQIQATLMGKEKQLAQLALSMKQELDDTELTERQKLLIKQYYAEQARTILQEQERQWMTAPNIERGFLTQAPPQFQQVQQDPLRRLDPIATSTASSAKSNEQVVHLLEQIIVVLSQNPTEYVDLG